MKKKFILFCGVNWCGTTSLYYTLTDNVKYMHGGWAKETMTLCNIFPEFYEHRKTLITKRCTYESLFRNLNYINLKEKNNKDQVLLQFTESELNSFFGPNVTLEKYVDHYVKLAEYCGNNYQAVGDFSNQNFVFNHQVFDQIRSELIKHFDVKVLFIFRDPIRKSWSQTCALTAGIKFPRRYKANSKVIDNFKETGSYRYAQKVKTAYEVFGKENVHYVIMEDFFKNEKNNSEVSKLEQFLNISIPQVYPCVFVPDKGIHPPKIDRLSDQWLSDTEILTPEFYNSVRFNKEYSQSYSEFEELHGFLPADWGRPVDYGY